MTGGGVSRLVTGAVLKTVVAEHLGQAGSIPVRLRHTLARSSPGGAGGRPVGVARRAPTSSSTRPLSPMPCDVLAGRPSSASSSTCCGSAARAASRRTTRSQSCSSSLPRSASSLREVINATGVVVHTNLGRAPLSAAAVDAVVTAAGATDVELDLTTGRRGPRGEGALAALAAAVPDAGGVHVVNNGAAALALVDVVPGPRSRGRGLPRRAGRDRRRLPHPRAAGVGGRPAAGGRHHEPGAARRLRATPSARTRLSSSRCTRRTSASRASPRRCRSASWQRWACRLSRTSAPACWRHTRGCPTSPMPRAACATGPTSSPPRATSCSAGRSAACCSAAPTSSSGCGGTRSRGRCASTS